VFSPSVSLNTVAPIPAKCDLSVWNRLDHKTKRAEVKTNELFDLQDQVERAKQRFSNDYSASSEVLSLRRFATRLDTSVSTQPAGFQGSEEWGLLSSDLCRLAAAYKTALLRPGQALGA